MTRRDWWIGVVLVFIGLLAHAASTRYEFILTPMSTLGPRAVVRGDRWTGALQIQAADHGWRDVPAMARPHMGAYTDADVVPDPDPR